MLKLRPPVAITTERSLLLLPLALTALLVAVIPAKLLPVGVAPMEIPSTLGVAPGAAPQQSVAPAEPVAPSPIRVLPSESVPQTAAPTAAEPDTAAIALGARRASPPAALPGETWIDRLPRQTGTAEGSGDLRLRTKQPGAIPALLDGIKQALKRLQATPATRNATAPGALRARHQPTPARPGPRLPVPALAPHPIAGVGAVGGPLPPRGSLGGPTPLAARYAPSIDGAAMGALRQRGSQP